MAPGSTVFQGASYWPPAPSPCPQQCSPEARGSCAEGAEQPQGLAHGLTWAKLPDLQVSFSSFNPTDASTPQTLSPVTAGTFFLIASQEK